MGWSGAQVVLMCIFFVPGAYFTSEYVKIKSKIEALEVATRLPAEELSPLSYLTADEVLSVGTVFLPSKVSEILLTNKKLLQFYNFSRKELDKPQSVPKAAVDMLVVPNSYLKLPKLDFVSERLEKLGVVVLQNVVSAQLCGAVSEQIGAELTGDPETGGHAISMGGAALNIYQNLHLRIKRLLKLQFEGEGSRVTVDEFGAFYPSPQADDSEFEPGASCHPEKERSTGKSFIVIVNLEDKFSSDVLRIIPASHTDVHRLEKLERDYLKSIPTTPMSLPQGSVVVMNKCTYFRYTTSSARLDSASKPLLFFSFLQPGNDNAGKVPQHPARKLMKEEDEGKYEL